MVPLVLLTRLLSRVSLLQPKEATATQQRRLLQMKGKIKCC